MGRILSNCGTMPSPLRRAYYRWVNGVINYVEAQCPSARSITYYVNQSGSGSSTGGGGAGTLGSPYLVKDAKDLNTLIGATIATAVTAANGSNTDAAILLRCGDVFRANATTPQASGVSIPGANYTLSSYVDTNVADARARLRPPIITGFTTPVTAGWTNDATYTNVWYRDYTSSTRPYAVQFSDADASRGPNTDVFRYVDNYAGARVGGSFLTVAAAATALNTMNTTAVNCFTTVADAGAPLYRIYVRLATGNPNTTTSLEVLQSTGVGVNVADVDGVRVEGISGEGWGFDNATDGMFAGTQEPPFLTQVSGTKMTYFKNNMARFSGTHLIEQYGAADGGTMVCNGCVAGWVTGRENSTATPFEGYCPASGNLGGNEMFCINCRLNYGALPVDSFTTGNSSPAITAFYNHTGSTSYPPALTVAAFCSVDDNIPTQTVSVEFASGDAPVPSDPNDASTYRTIVFGGRHGAGLYNRFTLPRFGVVSNFIAPRARFASLNSGTLNQDIRGAGTYAHLSVVGNSEIVFDFTNAPASALVNLSRAAGSNSYRVHFTHTRVMFICTDKNQSLEFVNRFQQADADGGLSRLVNCDFYCTWAEVTNANLISMRMGFPNQTCSTSQGGYKGCAFFGWQPINVNFGAGNDVWGYNASSPYYDPSNTSGFNSFPAIGAVHPALISKVGEHPIPTLDTDMDFHGHTRPSIRSVGPYESTVPALDSRLRNRNI